MVENEVFLLQISDTLKLLIAGWLLFCWIPARVFPQEYIKDPFDGVIFNIVHMTAVITLVFPLFIYLKLFGLPFLVLFFLAARLLFVRFYYGRSIAEYIRGRYHGAVYSLLGIIERKKAYARALRRDLRKKWKALKMIASRASFIQVLYLFTLLSVMADFLFLRLYRGYISMAPAVPDMYQYYYWNNILKLNILFDKTAGAPYMWGGPVLVYTVNLFAHIKTVLLYNIFPLLFLILSGLSAVYFISRLAGGRERTFAPVIALAVFGIVMASPLSGIFFGKTYVTGSPELFKTFFSFFSFFSGVPARKGQLLVTYPFIFFWRFTTTLPYEMASCFFLLNLYFLAKYLQTRTNTYLLLYAESLAIILAIHGGVAIPLMLPSFLMVLCGPLLGFDLKAFYRLLLSVLAAGALGNAWTLQFLVYGLPADIGAAAPVLDKLFHTKRAMQAAFSTSAGSVQITVPNIFHGALVLTAVCLFTLGVLKKKVRLPFITVSLASAGVLLLYMAPNMGLPRIVDQSRLLVFLAYSYAMAAGMVYFLIEKGVLRKLAGRHYLYISGAAVTLLVTASVLMAPRWIDTPMFWNFIYGSGHKEMPYAINRITDDFPPFTYNIVADASAFPQILTKGYHINSRDFIQQYDPVGRELKIASDYVFIFLEKEPRDITWLGGYQDSWRKDISMDLNAWVALYAARHKNISLWYKGQNLEVYLINNIPYQKLLYSKRRSLEESAR